MNTEHIAFTTRNPGPLRSLYKDEAKSLIDTQLIALNRGLLEVLSRFQLNEAVRTWHGTIRAIEEFINIPLFGIRDPRVVAWLSSIRLDDLFQPDGVRAFHVVRQALSEHLEEDVVQRYLCLLMQTVAIAQAFKINLQPVFGAGITLDTVGAAVNYFMSLVAATSFRCFTPCLTRAEERMSLHRSIP